MNPFPSIVQELKRGINDIAQLVADAERHAKAQRREWEIERQNRRKEEAERRAATALEASKADPLQLIARWTEARNIEQFLADVEKDLLKFDPEVREILSGVGRDRGIGVHGASTVDAVGSQCTSGSRKSAGS